MQIRDCRLGGGETAKLRGSKLSETFTKAAEIFRTKTVTNCTLSVCKRDVCFAGGGFCEKSQQWLGVEGAEAPVSFSIGMPWHSPDECEFVGMQSSGTHSAGVTTDRTAANRANTQTNLCAIFGVRLGFSVQDQFPIFCNANMAVFTLPEA